MSETEDNNLFKEELLPVASTVLRLNTKLRPLGRVASSTSRQLVAEFVVVVRDFVAQLELLVDKRANVSGLVETQGLDRLFARFNRSANRIRLEDGC